MAKIAINGMGRIGRAAFKVIMETPQLELVAVNDLMPTDNLAYLIRYDTVYGKYGKDVTVKGDSLSVGGKSFKVLHEKDPEQLPWKEMEVDLVIESTGFFTKAPDMQKHIKAGARMVILSAESKSDEVATVVYGASSTQPENPTLVSCASCTTNCITPLVEIMGRRIGIKKAVLTTVHAYTATQTLVDGPMKKEFSRGRAAAQNLVPTTTGAATATTKALPEYKGKFDGVSVRSPVPVGSISDVVFVTSRPTTVDEIKKVFREEAQSARYRDVLGVSDEPIVSSDIIQDPRASVVDLDMTRVVDGDLVKVMSWYDNEWGYANQMIREAVSMTSGSREAELTASAQKGK
ncbi:MAG: type I glyceraldehyde-3-phosphate dehydrogenase [Deltaproteobacteria bacterium]